MRLEADDECRACHGTGIRSRVNAWRCDTLVVRGGESVGFLCYCARVHVAPLTPAPPSEMRCRCGEQATSRWTSNEGETLYACPRCFVTIMAEHPIVSEWV